MKKVKNDERQYHLGLSNDMIEDADYAVLINDKQFVEPIAKILDPKARYIHENREYYTFSADVKSNKIAVISTGLGGPSMGIGIEEMATIGIKYFIRLGETGAIQPNMEIGDLVLSKAAMRMEETSKHYAPENYPAVSSFEMTNIFHRCLKKHRLKYHYGITVTTDTFWPSQGRRGYLNFIPARFQNILEEWQKYRILSVDLELATLFTICNTFNLDAVGILDVTSKNYETDSIDEVPAEQRISCWQNFLKDAIEMDILQKQ